MCNGSGSVRVHVSDLSEEEIFQLQHGSAKKADLFDLRKIPTIVHARINKNEYQQFAQSVVHHLRTFDYRRAATGFNHLMHLLAGVDDGPEKNIREELRKLKRVYLDDLIFGASTSARQDSSNNHFAAIENIQKSFAAIYNHYFEHQRRYTP